MAAVTKRRPLAPWLRRFPLYLFAWVMLVIPFAYGAEQWVREAFIVPACEAYGRERGVAFVSYSKGGGSLGDVLGLTGTYSSPGCYFRGTPSFVPLRAIGGAGFTYAALLGGTGAVFVGLLLDTIAVVLAAWLIERLLALRRGDKM